MDVVVYKQSMNYFRRYELLQLMEVIALRDPIPLSERTINYFVESVIKNFAFSEWDRYHRYIFDSESDSDVDKTGKTRTPRHLRRLHRSEVRGAFAEHADWILEDQKAKRPSKRVVDIAVWEGFCRLADIDRIAAAAKDVRWGIARGKKVEDYTRCIESTREPIAMGKKAATPSIVDELAIAKKRGKKRKAQAKVRHYPLRYRA